MLLLTTSLSGRALALASSLVFHAGVVVALGSSSSSTPMSLAAPSTTLDIMVLEQPLIELPREPATAPMPAPRAPRPHGHTHAYPVSDAHGAEPHDSALVHAPLARPRARIDPAPASPEGRLDAPLAAPATHPPPSFALSVPAVQASAPPSFALSAGHTHAAPPGATESAVHGSGEVEPAATVDTPARLLVGAPPAYPQAAAEAQLEADVPLEIVVSASGRVVSARVLARHGYGLDAAALTGVRGYRFSPAMLHGKATAVRMTWTMLFRLQ